MHRTILHEYQRADERAAFFFLFPFFFRFNPSLPSFSSREDVRDAMGVRERALRAPEERRGSVDDKGLRRRRRIDRSDPPGDTLAILRRASLLHRQTSG